MFSDQGNQTYRPSTIFGDKHPEVQEGTWEFQAICGLVPLMAIVPSRVARPAQHSLALKVLSVVLFAHGRLKRTPSCMRLFDKELGSQADSEKRRWSYVPLPSDRAGISQRPWTVNPTRTVNCS